MKRKSKSNWEISSFFVKGNRTASKGNLSSLKKRGFSLLVQLFFFLSTLLLYASAFPGIFFSKGFFLAGWFVLLPLFFLVDWLSVKQLVFWGFLTGVFSYLLIGYWLFTFHSLAAFFVLLGQGIYYLILFLLLKPILSLSLFQNHFFSLLAALAVASLWTIYEWIKMSGFLGYPYGILAYSQYRFLPLLQSADCWGVQGISFLLVFMQGLLFFSLKFFFKQKRFRSWIPFSLSVFILFVILMTGLSELSQPKERRNPSGSFSILLVQSNAGILPSEQWKGKNGRRDLVYRKSSNYQEDFQLLKRLTLEGVKQAKKKGESLDLIVWPETAFVPAIQWYRLYGGVHANLVNQLLAFQEELGIPLLTGNSHGVKAKKNFSRESRIDYNAAILLCQGKITGVYSKQKLVPFSESYPFGESFPALKEFLSDRLDCSFWERGKGRTLFELPTQNQTRLVRWVTPICFEDGFGNHLRKMVSDRQEVDFILNLTNDSWSGSDAAQRQHLAFSIFRAVENRLPVIRVAQSGMSGVVSPEGRWLEEISPFTQGFLLVEVPLRRALSKELIPCSCCAGKRVSHPQTVTMEKSLYQRGGDFMGWISLLIFGGWNSFYFFERKKRSKKSN